MVLGEARLQHKLLNERRQQQEQLVWGGRRRERRRRQGGDFGRERSVLVVRERKGGEAREGARTGGKYI